MSEETRDRIAKVVESLGLTPDDIRRYMHLISLYYYYEVEVKGKRPSDVVIEVQPLPSDIKNIGAFLAAWRNLMTQVMKDIASTLRSLTPEEERMSFSRPEDVIRYMLMKQFGGQGKGEAGEEERSVPELEPEETEALKASIEKVKKMMEGSKDGSRGRGEGTGGSTDTSK